METIAFVSLIVCWIHLSQLILALSFGSTTVL